MSCSFYMLSPINDSLLVDYSIKDDDKPIDDQVNELRSIFVSSSRISMLPATLIPVRTNNLSNFSKDFFLPTTLNHAVRTQGTFKKVIAVVGAILLDLLTLPIRFITSAPRAFCNAVFQNPLIKLVKKESEKHREFINLETVRIRLQHRGVRSLLECNLIQLPE